MNFKKTTLSLGIVLALSSVSAVQAESYIVMSKTNSLSSKMMKDIEATGATITATLPQVGMFVVESNDVDFQDKAVKVNGVRSAFHNLEMSLINPVDVDAPTISLDAASPPNTGDDDFFFDLQWGHTAIQATDAWELGHRGAGVRVAVIDSGIDSSHPDLTPNLNTALSASFVPGEDYDNPAGSHGTHVAGTIAAADNAFGTIGVAPEAEIVAIKALSPVGGGGSTSGIWQAMIYAADIEADVVNMSFGFRGGLPINCKFDDGNGGTVNLKFCREILVGYNRVTHYMNGAGVTLIGSGGNDARDTNKDGSTTILPNAAHHVISVSALAPEGWGLDQTTDLDILSSFSNFGKDIDMSAPGGDFSFAFDDDGNLGPGFDFCDGPVVPGLRCYRYDGILSTVVGGWNFFFGTSMASPHVAGVAALIIGANGGDMDPVEVKKALYKGADDLGKPGKDAVYGHGRVNALGSVQ